MHVPVDEFTLKCLHELQGEKWQTISLVGPNQELGAISYEVFGEHANVGGTVEIYTENSNYFYLYDDPGAETPSWGMEPELFRLRCRKGQDEFPYSGEEFDSGEKFDPPGPDRQRLNPHLAMHEQRTSTAISSFFTGLNRIELLTMGDWIDREKVPTELQQLPYVPKGGEGLEDASFFVVDVGILITSPAGKRLVIQTGLDLCGHMHVYWKEEGIEEILKYCRVRPLA